MFYRPGNPLRVLSALMILLAVIGVSACTAQTPPQPTQSERTELTVQLAWIHEYSSSPFYAAEQNGHFAAEGLQVRFAEGGFTSEGMIDPISEVLDGSAAIGLTSGAGLIAARAEGKPVVAKGTEPCRSRNPDRLPRNSRLSPGRGINCAGG